ncbi:mechanosensitive ion channel family protein [Alkanindiges sp. WGS2144]|uniref:mechanosensitive ion channel family protein n=1 Tax=Alkanindiges sp. WGS2144 TaxID=3366808 RepID=UPI003750FC89
MADKKPHDASGNAADALSDATQATAELVQKAGEATTHKVIEKATKYKDVYTTVHEMAEHFWERVPYLIIALCVFLLFWLISKFFKFFVTRVISRRTKRKQNLVMVLNRIGSTFIVFIGFMIALVIAIPGFTPAQLISGLGIGSVAIGFAFKDIFQNMLSGILILLGEPFRIGDEIVSGAFTGTVENIQIRATYIRTGDGRRIVIPNANLFTNPVTVNTAFLKRQCEFETSISYTNDIQAVKQIILEVMDHIQTVQTQPAAAVQVKTLGEAFIVLHVSWWVDVKDTSIGASIDEVQTRVKEAFAQQGVVIA